MLSFLPSCYSSYGAWTLTRWDLHPLFMPALAGRTVYQDLSSSPMLLIGWHRRAQRPGSEQSEIALFEHSLAFDQLQTDLFWPDS
jgi:hypothetical protein